MDIVSRARSGPLSWADKMTLDSLQTGELTSHFKPASVLNLPYMEKKVDRTKFSNITSLDDLVTASLKGYVPHPHASKDLQNLFTKALAITASSYASSTKNQYKKAWDRFSGFCWDHGIDPMKADGPKVAVWLV